MEYIAFIAGLPEIVKDDRKLPVLLSDFREQLKDYIRGKDKQWMDLFFLPKDHEQILRLLDKKEPDESLQTVFPLKVLEESVSEPDKSLPEYLQDFIQDFKEEHLKYDVSPENVLSWMYYDYMQKVNNSFIRHYADFSMNVKNLVVALNARKYGRSLEKEIIGSNSFSTSLRTSTAKDFGLSMDYPYVEKIMSLMEHDNLVARERGIDMLVWEYLEEAVTFEYFSFEKVLSYMLRLMIVERWSKLNSESGRKVFMELVERFRKNFEFDEQFK